MKPDLQPKVLIAALALALSCAVAQADMTGNWTAVARLTIHTAGEPAAQSARGAQLVQEAMLRADQAARSANGTGNSARGESTQRREAAVAIAAYAVLEHLYPEQQVDLEVKLAVALADLPENAAKAEGLVIGRRSAAEVLGSTTLIERRAAVEVPSMK